MWLDTTERIYKSTQCNWLPPRLRRCANSIGRRCASWRFCRTHKHPGAVACSGGESVLLRLLAKLWLESATNVLPPPADVTCRQRPPWLRQHSAQRRLGQTRRRRQRWLRLCETFALLLRFSIALQNILGRFRENSRSWCGQRRR